MAKKCFLSFHYAKDNWRVQQVMKMGEIEGQPLMSYNDWEAVKKKGDDAIKKYIASEMKNKKCLIVLIGEETSGRRWVKYEIKKAWSDGLGVCGIYVHNLKGSDKIQSAKGSNPFAGLSVDGTAITAKVYDPPFQTSQDVYGWIEENLEGVVDSAIAARNSK